MLDARIDRRMAYTPRGVAPVPYVVLRLGTAEVAEWRVPAAGLKIADADPQGYADQFAAEKLAAALDWYDTADRLYGDTETQPS